MPDEEVTIAILGDASNLVSENNKARQSIAALQAQAEEIGNTLQKTYGTKLGTVAKAFTGLAESIAKTNQQIVANASDVNAKLASAETKRMETSQRIQRLQTQNRLDALQEIEMGLQRLNAIESEYAAKRAAIDARANADAAAAIEKANIEALKLSTTRKTDRLAIVAEGHEEARRIGVKAAADLELINSEQNAAILRSEENLSVNLARISRETAARRKSDAVQAESEIQRLEKFRLDIVLKTLSEMESEEKRSHAERLAEDKRFLSERLSELKAARDAEVSAEREADSLMASAHKEATASFKEDMRDQAAASKAGGGRSVFSGNGYNMRQAGDTLFSAAAYTGVPLAAAAYGASSYQDAYLNSVNNTDLNQTERKQVRAGVGNLIDQGTDQPLSSLFDAFKQASDFRKNGQTIAQTMQIVDIAVKAASADNADAGETTKALAQAMYQFNVPAADASRVMNLMEVTAAKNNLTLSQLTDNIGRAAATAAELGTPLNQIIATYGVLTKEGYTAGQSATSLRSIFKSLAEPTAAQQKSIAELSKTYPGLSEAFGYANVHARGLAGTLDYLSQITGGNREVLLKLLPDQRSNIAAMSLMTDRAKDLHETLAEGTKAWQDNSRIQEQFAEKSQTASFQCKALVNQLLKAADGLGKELLPKLIWLVHLLTDAAKWFDNLSPGVKSATVNLLLGATAIELVGGAALRLIGNLQFLANGFKTIAGWLGKVTLASEAAATAEGAVAAEGLSAFAIGGPLAVAIAAFAAGCVYWWNQISKAQGEAADSAKAYGDRLDALKSGSLRDKLMAVQQATGVESGDIASARKEAMAFSGNRAEQNLSYASQMSSLGYDTSKPQYSDVGQGLVRQIALLKDRAQVIAQLGALNKEGAGAANRTLAGGGTAGDAIAQAALSAHMNGSADKYREYCQRLVKETVDTVTHKYDQYFAGSASETMRNFQKAGIGHAYKPGMPLAPGDLLYNNAWGRNKATGRVDGHAMIMGPDGKILDNVGGGSADPSKRLIQWVVPMGGSGSGLPAYMNPAGGATGPMATGKTRSGGIGGLGSPLSPPTLDASLAPMRQAAAATGAYEKAIAKLDAAEQAEIATAKKSGAALDVLKVQIAETTAKIALDKKTTEDSAKARPALIAAQEAAFQKYRAAVSSAVKISGEFNALQAKMNKEKEGGAKPTEQQTLHLHGLRLAYGSLQKSVADYRKETLSAQENVKRLDATIQDSERNILAHQNALDRLNQDVASKNQRSAMAAVANLTAAGKGGAAGHDALMAGYDAQKVSAANSAGLGSLSGSTAAQLLSILSQMKDKTDQQVAAAAVLKTLVSQIDAEAKRFSAETMASLVKQYRSIMGNPALSSQSKLDSLQGGGTDFSGIKTYANDIKKLQQDITLSAQTEALKQNAIDRQELIRRVANYGMDRDAFLSAMMDKTRALAESITGDANMETAGQQEMLDSVRARLSAEESGHTDATARQIALDQKKAAAMQDNLNAMTVMRNKWAKQDEKAAKEVTQAWQDGIKHVEETFSSDVAGMLTGTKKHMTSLTDLFRATFDNILQVIIKNFVMNSLLELAKVWTHQGKSGSGSGQGSSYGPMVPMASGGGGSMSGLGGAIMLGAQAAGIYGSLRPNAKGGSPAAAGGGEGAMARAAMPGWGFAGTSLSTGGSTGSGSQVMGDASMGMTAVKTAGSLGAKTGALGAAMPYVGAALTVAGIIGSLLQRKPDYVDKIGKSKDGLISGSDYSSAIDSGYSGVSGMRALGQQRADLLSRMAKSGTGAGSSILQIHPGAITINGSSDPEGTADAVMRRIQDQFVIGNAATGSGGF